MYKKYRKHAFTGLYLEKPYGCVYSNAKWPACFFELLNGKLRQRYTSPRADFLVDAVRISDTTTDVQCGTHP